MGLYKEKEGLLNLFHKESYFTLPHDWTYETVALVRHDNLNACR